MLKVFLKQALLSLILAFYSGLLLARDSSPQTIQVDLASKHFDAPRTEIAPVIDGIIDGDPAWLGAHLINDLYQTRPNEYLPATEKTEFLITYDSDNLYVAARIYYKNKDNIVANILRNGEQIWSDDRVGLILDPFGDGRRGYLFNLNSNSVLGELLYVGTSGFQPDWEGIWQGQSASTEYGWSTEMQIPFKTLSFNPNAETWGINFQRTHMETAERIGWYSQNQAMNPGASGTMTALRNINQGLGLDIEPSLSVRAHKNNKTGESSSSFAPSLDAFYKITPSLNAAVTINTDFSATEVDDQQVNLTQFNLFFPEKREFFLRDFDIFDFGNIGAREQRTFFGGAQRQNSRPFFSRRIGLASTGESTGIEGGIKVSGDYAGLNIGGLVIRQSEFGSLGETDLFVGRVAKNVLQESSIGMIYTDGDPTLDAKNSLVGADFRYRNTRLGRGKAFYADAWYQQTEGDIVQNDEYSYGVKLSVPSTTGLGGVLQYQEIGENYNPALGFVSRKGVRLKRAQFVYNTLSADRVVQRSNPGAEYISWEYLDDNQIQTRLYNIKPIDITSQRGDRLWAMVGRREASVRNSNDQPLRRLGIILPIGHYGWNIAGIGVDTSNRRKLRTISRIMFGDYYQDGRLFDFSSDTSWRLSKNFNFTFGLNYVDVDLPQGSFISRLLDFKVDWVFSQQLSLSNLVQYNNISESLGFNSRLHWAPKPGQDVFLVLNQGWEDRDLDNSFIRTEQDLTLKASYTFRF